MIFIFFVLAGLFGVSQQEQQFDFTDPFPKDSFVRTYFTAVGLYTSPESILRHRAALYFKGVDVSKPDNRKQMKRYVDDFFASNVVSKYPSCWVENFDDFLGRTETVSNSSDSFKQAFDSFLESSPYGDLYANDVVRDTDGTITASRCHMSLTKLLCLAFKVS